MVGILDSIQQGQSWADRLFQTQANRTAGAALASGDYGGAAGALGRVGDLQGVAGVQTMQRAAEDRATTQQEQQRARALQTTLSAARALRRTRDEGGDVAAELARLRPTFLAMGTDPGELQQIEGAIVQNPAFLDDVETIVGQQLRELSFQKSGEQLLVFEEGNPDPIRQFSPPREPIVAGNVIYDPETFEVLGDSRRPEFFETEDGGAPVIVGVDPRTGRSSTVFRGQAPAPAVRTLSEAEVRAAGLQPGVYQQDREGRITQVEGQGGDRLTAGQARQVESYYQDVATIDNINAELGRFRGMIQGGQLNLGPTANAVGGIRNTLGISSENSRNLAEFQSTLERIRNDSLRLNSGVQTEGDAQRAWNELVSNINDEQVVLRQLARIEEINRRARAFREQRISALEGGAQSPTPAPVSRQQGPRIGSRENPYRLNPNDPSVGWSRIRSGDYFRHPDGTIRRKP